MWKLVLPAYLVKYLLQAIRAASKASEESYKSSSRDNSIPAPSHRKACERRRGRHQRRRSCNQYRRYESWDLGKVGGWRGQRHTRDTTAETRLDVRLVLTVTIAIRSINDNFANLHTNEQDLGGTINRGQREKDIRRPILFGNK